METPTTKTIGMMVVAAPDKLYKPGTGSSYKPAIKRKYKLAILLNCSNKFKGRKVRQLYLLVHT